MNAFRVELVIGFALLALVGIPALVVRILEWRSRRAPPLTASGSVPALSVKSEAKGRACPYCKDAIAEDAVHIECATCRTWHHATCFEENQGCAVYGCKEKRGLGHAERTT